MKIQLAAMTGSATATAAEVPVADVYAAVLDQLELT